MEEGGLITRGYVQRYNDPPVYNYITWLPFSLAANTHPHPLKLPSWPQAKQTACALSLPLFPSLSLLAVPPFCSSLQIQFVVAYLFAYFHMANKELLGQVHMVDNLVYLM